MLHREPGRPLITVSNHASTLDDPTLFCAMLPLSLFATESQHGKVRWTLCANEMCHQNKLLSEFFLSGKTLPIVRGAGQEQPVLALVARQLRTRGDWLHVFPEGRVRQDGRMNPLKSGLAHVLCDVAPASPVVLPFHHRGMERVIKAKTSRPRMNNRVSVVVGEPIQLADLLQRCRKVRAAHACSGVCVAHGMRVRHIAQKGEDQQLLARDIMKRLADSLEALRKENEGDG